MSDNRVEVEVELSNEAIATLDAEAAARGISRDDLVNEILNDVIKKHEHRIWVEDLKVRLDEVMEDIELNGNKYFICDDKELNHPTAVFMSIDEYNALVKALNS